MFQIFNFCAFRINITVMKKSPNFPFNYVAILVSVCASIDRFKK